jgi:hypothetical protein
MCKFLNLKYTYPPVVTALIFASETCLYVFLSHALAVLDEPILAKVALAISILHGFLESALYVNEKKLWRMFRSRVAPAVEQPEE